LLEILSFKQLGLHDKPVVVLDAFGYWQPLLQMLDRALAEGFVQPRFRGLWHAVATPEQAIAWLATAPRWSPAAADRANAADAPGGGTA
jgi:predicted Rossmann-fold nucleotide-binding protein